MSIRSMLFAAHRIASGSSHHLMVCGPWRQEHPTRRDDRDRYYTGRT